VDEGIAFPDLPEIADGSGDFPFAISYSGDA